MLIMDHQPAIWEMTCFYEDHLEVLGGNGGRTPLFYSNLKGEKFSEHLYIVIFQGDIAVVMRRDSLTKGTLDQARALPHRGGDQNR